jgi:hypothetical protein
MAAVLGLAVWIIMAIMGGLAVAAREGIRK